MTTKVTPSTTIVMEPEKVTVTVVNEVGMKKTTNTNIESIQQIFMKEQALETPLLPSQWGVVKYYRKNNYEGYVMTTPAMERKVRFDCGRSIPEEIILPVPPMLWIFEVREDGNGSKYLQHSMCYVLKHELISFKDQVLHAPYPNIGISHGICWGRNIPEAPSSKSLQNLPARFFSAPFNFDLSGNRVKSFMRYDEGRGEEVSTDVAIYHMTKLAKELEDSKEAGETYSYPFDTLKSGTNMTVEQVVKSWLPSIFA